MVLLLYVLVLCLTSWSVDGTRSDYVGYMQPYTRTSWGSWGHLEWCDEGTYAYAFRLKVEEGQGIGDDTALNGIELLCSNYCGEHSNRVTSKVGPWGKWKIKTCPLQSFLKSAQARSEPHIEGDNTAANNYEFRCEKADYPRHTYNLVGGGMYYGSWASRNDCPSGSYICGIQTQVEPRQGWGDDTALNDARFYCCSFRKRFCWWQVVGR